MTELLCHTDSYVQEFDATVVAADAAKSAVVLDRTAFTPAAVANHTILVGYRPAGRPSPSPGSHVRMASCGTPSLVRCPPWAPRCTDALIGSGVISSCGPIRPCTCCVASSGVTTAPW